MPGCRKKGLDHVLLRVLQCPTLWFPSPERKGQAMITEVMLQLCLASPCKVDLWCASKQTIMKDKSNLSSLMRPNGLTLWLSLPALKNSIFYFLHAASSFSFQLFIEGRILSSFSSTGALHLLGNAYSLHPLARGYSVWQVKNPRFAPGGRAMIQCLEVWKLYLNFVTQQDTQRKITLLKSIVIHENTLSASTKIAVWQFLSCKAAPMQDAAINPVSDEWTSKWKHPCLHGTVKHRQARAEADHQDAPLHQPWRNIYSEDKNWKLQ